MPSVSIYENLNRKKKKTQTHVHHTYLIIVPQLDEINVPIYPTHGTSVLSSVIAGQMAGGIGFIGIFVKNH
jgi:hypothetical protein